MDLGPNPKKRPWSLAAILALVSLGLILGGICVSRSATVTETPMGTLVDATRHVRDSTDELPQVFFWAAVVVSAAFVCVYLFTLSTRNPYGKRRTKWD